MMLYGWREREEVLRFFEKVTGLRMNHNYIRPGGVAADLPDGWQRRRAATAATSIAAAARRVRRRCSPASPIWRERLQGVGVITTEEASRSAPPARSCAPPASPGTCAGDMPYLAYDQVDFDVIVGTYGDCFDRYAIRLNEIRESIKHRAPVLEQMPTRRLPHPGQEGHAAAAGPHRRVDGSADPPLQDLHRGLQGARGRGLRRRRVAPRRARLLPRVRRHRQARTACTSAARAS